MAEGYTDNPYKQINKTSNITLNGTYIISGTCLYCYEVCGLAICSINFGTKQNIPVNTQIMSGFPNSIGQFVCAISANATIAGRLRISNNGDLITDAELPGNGYYYNGILVYPIAN